jgi:hypothetical protein
MSITALVGMSGWNPKNNYLTSPSTYVIDGSIKGVNMTTQTVKLNKRSMQLMDDKSVVNLQFTESEGVKTPQLQMVAYSGGIIAGHWYWGDLAIDLEGMSIPKTKIPILEDHSTSMKIGFATKFSKENNQLTVVESSFIDTPESLKFREASGAGFPYEASIYAKPSTVQTLNAGETAMVNGYEMKGPGSIWRKCTLKEASVCTFGYDTNTSSAAMSDGEDVEIEYNKSEQLTNKEETMDINQLKKDHPELVALLFTEAVAGVETKFVAERTALETQLADLKALNTQLSEENKGAEKRLLALEKAEAIRAEQNLKYSADAIFNEKFKEAGLPDRLAAKIRRIVGHDEFIADGKLDTEAFAAAVATELKDWETDADSVHGFGASTKDHGANEETKLSKVCEETADRMLKYLK